MTGLGTISTPGGVTIRRAVAADAEAAVQLLWDVGAEGRWIGAEVPFDRDARRSRLLDDLGRVDYLLLVADADGEVVGELSMDLAAYGTADLGMALRNGYRGQGLGTTMLDAGLEWAREAGAGKVSLEVWPDNEAARSLYIKFGFVEEGRRRHHYRRRSGEVWDAVLMGLPLNRSPWPVRLVTDADGWEIVALVAGCWSEYPGCVMDAHGECSDLLAPATAFAAKQGAMWVVEGAGGEIVSSVGTAPGPDGVAELLKLYVARRYRRRGLARYLVALVETYAAEHGAARMELWSDTRFTDAHRLYSTLGYRATGTTRELGDLSSTVEMHFEKELAVSR